MSTSENVVGAATALSAEQMVAVADRSTPGLVAMILGIASLVFGGPLLGIPAIILGVKSRRLAAAGLASNRGQATAGLVLGWVTTGALLLVLALILLRFAAAAAFQH